ncbi:MAG TPA: DUF2911 domain-containing protein [Chthoniobacterales bacterium]|nr:DUF2911 domain-containing protein [Chthoniobacterales bacterium]
MNPKIISRAGCVLPALLFFVAKAGAQTDLNLPEASQKAVLTQRVGITDITINYHRPLVKGRKVWGELVPMGKVWRAGANENTTIEFSTPVSVEGKPLPAGKYGLHMIPAADTWTIIFSKMTVAWGSYSYNQAEDALRVMVKPHPAQMEEALKYDFEDLQRDSVVVTMNWEKLAVPFRVSIDEVATVLPAIRDQLRGRAQYSWSPLAEAAQYCLTNKTNLEEALKWADESIRVENRFENLMLKADLLAALKKPEEKSFRDLALQRADDITLYSYGRKLQLENRNAEAMAIFPAVVQRFPDSMMAHLAQARLKSAAGDFAAAAEETKKAQGMSKSDEQKASLQKLIGQLEAKQDINK